MLISDWPLTIKGALELWWRPAHLFRLISELIVNHFYNAERHNYMLNKRPSVRYDPD